MAKTDRVAGPVGNRQLIAGRSLSMSQNMPYDIIESGYSNMAATRRKARILALQALYEIDSVRREPDTVIERALASAEMSEENRNFVREVVSGTVGNREEIDGKIRQLAPAWPLDQIAVVDRNILRLAIFEILYNNKVPVKVAVNEAVELAKTFGSESSAKFINGVLGAVSAKAGR